MTPSLNYNSDWMRRLILEVIAHLQIILIALGWFNTALLASTVVAPVAFVARETTNLLHLDSTYLIAALGSVALLATELGLRPLTRVSHSNE
jgi:hypothetical protein